MDKRRMRLGMTVWAVVVGTFLVLPSVRAADLSPKFQELLREAQDLQEKGEYARAWEKYHQIRRAEHNPPKEVTEGYQFCLRRVQQARRLRDKPSQALLADLSTSDALSMYTRALTDLRKNYFDLNKVGVEELFQYGVQEMRFALEDEAFLKDQLRDDFEPAKLAALKAWLDGLREERLKLKEPEDARKHLQGVMLSAFGLGIKPTAVLVEFISGACNALDEYTGYLSPRRLAENDTDLTGKFVGIGIDVAVMTGKAGKQLVIRRVYPGSPAEKEALERGQIILSIDGQAPDPAVPGALVARLEGETGTKVELEIAYAGTDGMKRKVTVERQPVSIPSVEAGYVPGTSGIAYVRIVAFHKTTPQELRSELLFLRSQPGGLKAIVLDLRGNLGGAFEAGIQVAEQFLPEGVITHVQMRTREKERRANNPDALTVPLVVLVDGETASAAELVAGALKDNNRATLVGQTTYGKGSVQVPVKLEKLKAAMQVTVARFSSPERVPYDGHGVTPDHLVENTMMMMSADPQYDFALDQAKRKVEMPAPLKMPL